MLVVCLVISVCNHVHVVVLNVLVGISEGGILPEDMELTRHMNELGLPVSFQTNKQVH